MNTLELQNNLLELLKVFIDETEIQVDIAVDENTRLIGSSAIFDSFDLVAFIVEAEQYLENQYEIEIQLASPRAMSRRSSPFISIKRLSEYIIEIVNE